MAAAASTFTVHIANMAGEMIDIDDMSNNNMVSQLKDKIALKIGKSKDAIQLTHMDDSEKGFTVLENLKRLGDYNIDYASDELKLVINIPRKTGDVARFDFTKYLKDVKSLEPVPDNITVVHKLTPDMNDKIIYILPEKEAKQGLKCRIDEAGPIIPSSVSYHAPTQKIQIEVLKHGVILSFSGNSSPIYNALFQGRVFLENAAQGGRRRKRSTKRRLSRRRRTHRRYRK
jgi:hypothetical protein